MATQLAAARQPFAPLNGSRLQNLTSLKNRQNAIVNLSSPSKRKASTFEADNDNTENVDPVIFLSPKRSKNPDGTSAPLKPTNFFLTRAPPSPNDFTSCKPIASSRRPILSARSPAPRLNTDAPRSAPLSAPAGRSPTGKRIGILNRRKTGGSSPFTRVDPPKFSTGSSSTSSLGFSIDAALSGTIPSYAPRRNAIPILHQPESKDSWFFDIHEDTEEELATNLMEHRTCTLDISSDEESRARERDCRGKENVPPLDDVSQTRTSLSMSLIDRPEAEMRDVKARIKSSRKKRMDEDAIDVDRAPLGDLAAEDFYAEGCDPSSVFLIPSEASAEDAEEEEQTKSTFDFVADVKGKGKDVELDIDTLMSKDSSAFAPTAGLLEPIGKAEDGFTLWESGSDKGDA